MYIYIYTYIYVTSDCVARAQRGAARRGMVGYGTSVVRYGTVR